jgi:hypothetical protein
VAPGGSVHLMDLGKLLSGKELRRAHERRPKATVNECDLAVYQATHEDVVAPTNRLCELEDLAAPRMGPPASANGLACDSHRE